LKRLFVVAKMQGGGYAGEKPSMTDKVKNVLGMGGNHHTGSTGYGNSGTS
jgi:hypothetical protein